jgi:hypothetical protein
MNRHTDGTENGTAIAIGQALRLTIPIGRALGWTSERTYREAEAYAEARAHRAERRDSKAA